MIFGHAPAGYIVSKLALPLLGTDDVPAKTFIWYGVVGALAPDCDMLYFHLADHRQHHHHSYFSHYPVVWLSLLLLSAIWLVCARRKARATLATIFTLNGFFHMFFDTIVGDIQWLAPFSDKPYALFTVPALYNPWWLNFLLHWSFVIEITICALAVCLWRLWLCQGTVLPRKSVC